VGVDSLNCEIQRRVSDSMGEYLLGTVEPCRVGLKGLCGSGWSDFCLSIPLP